jgi:hypothetical protein
MCPAVDSPTERSNMTTTTNVPVLSVRSPAMPRGARVAGNLFVALLAWLGSRPARRAPSRNEEAAAVRQFASRVQRSDPGFAADLFAAADRHETKAD